MIGPLADLSLKTPSANDDRLFAAAQQLEASFLAEMLDAAGFGETRQSFGGGAGESQFSSLLLQEHAKAITQAGGIGLSEAIFEALKERNGEHQTE